MIDKGVVGDRIRAACLSQVLIGGAVGAFVRHLQVAKAVPKLDKLRHAKFRGDRGLWFAITLRQHFLSGCLNQQGLSQNGLSRLGDVWGRLGLSRAHLGHVMDRFEDVLGRVGVVLGCLDRLRDFLGKS